jgi:hypothetical protein
MNLGTPPSVRIREMKLPDVLEKVTQQLVLMIRGESVGGDLYRKVLTKIKSQNWKFDNAREARFAIAALTQERELLDEIGDKLPNLFDILLAMPNANLTKSLVRLYYAKFLKLEEIRQTIIVTEAIKHSLRSYDGKNPAVRYVQQESKILKADFDGILKDNAGKKLEEIAKVYWLVVNDEFYEQLRLSRILSHFNSLEFGKSWPNLFDEAKQHKSRDARTQNNRFIGEEAAYRLLSRCKNTGQIPCEAWQDFILQIVGDPRSHTVRHAWERIGIELRDYLIGVLSRDDLKEFLESISDGHGDEIYKYRKQFWSKYIPQVKNAKLLICPRDFNSLRTSNEALHRRIIENPTTYGRLSSGDKSYIYIDFVSVKIIEGTHNASIRFYHEMPIWFKNNSYELHDRSDIERITHGGQF